MLVFSLSWGTSSETLKGGVMKSFLENGPNLFKIYDTFSACGSLSNNIYISLFRDSIRVSFLIIKNI